MDAFRRGVLLALRMSARACIRAPSIREAVGVSVAQSKRYRRTLLEVADEMSLLDTPTAPDPKGARVVRPLDAPREQAKASVNNKTASLRALLYDNPDGMDYDQMAKATGIDRIKIPAFVGGLITSGDAKPYEIDGRRIFKFCGDPKRIGPRSDQAPKGASPVVKTVAAPPARTEPAAPKVPEAARPGTGVAEADPRKVEPAPSVKDTQLATPSSVAALTPPVTTGAAANPAGDHISQPGKLAPAPAKPRLYDLSTELTIIAAANLAAAVRDCSIEGVPELERALLNFERADKAREEAKGVA